MFISTACVYFSCQICGHYSFMSVFILLVDAMLILICMALFLLICICVSLFYDCIWVAVSVDFYGWLLSMLNWFTLTCILKW